MVGRRYSRQREQILSYVQSVKTHPTAEMVYEALKDRIPQLSLATVYRNLKLLTEDGVILRIPLPVERYDGTVEEHPHFWCSRCNRLLDLEKSDITIQTSLKSQAHQIARCEVLMTGVCADCVKKGGHT